MKESTARVVSSEDEPLILVDRNDIATGLLDKGACHDGDGILHRAFSLFLFDADGRLLLQQRAASKRLWPLYWSNSCCSHPRSGESVAIAAARRLGDELHTACELEFVYKFIYRARFGDLGTEHELCHVFLGRLHEAPAPNETEIAATKSLTAAELDAAFRDKPGEFTPWFVMEWRRLNEEFADRLAAYQAPA